MNIKKAVILSILFVFLVSFVPFGRTIKADEGYGVVTTEKGEMYKDTYGNLFPIIVLNGKKLVKISRYELEPLQDLLEKDAKEAKRKSTLPEYILKKYYASGSFAVNSQTYHALSSIVSYNQRYKGWHTYTLGFGPDTIGQSGCFLTSSAMMLATYNLTTYGSLVNPLNLNTWLKNNGGFSHDLIIFSALKNFPGIRDTDVFDHFSDAEILIYYGIIPIIRLSPEHYTPLVKTNGIADLDNNWIMNTYWRGHNSYDYSTNLGRVYSPYTNVPYYQSVRQSGYIFASSALFRTAYPTNY